MVDSKGALQKSKALTTSGPPIGEQIEVIIRYRGVEYREIAGKLLEVKIENETVNVPDYDDMYNRIELTGRTTLSLTVDRRAKESPC